MLRTDIEDVIESMPYRYGTEIHDVHYRMSQRGLPHLSWSPHALM